MRLSLGFILCSSLLPLSALATDLTPFPTPIPHYARVDNPQCTCSCENKIIYQPQPITDTSLQLWVKEAILESYNYGFGNYQNVLSKASQYFTPAGWNNFAEALAISGNLDIVRQQELVISAIPIGEPTDIRPVTINNNRGWEMTLPILVKYQSAAHTRRETLTVKVQIEQMQESLGTQGLGINQLIITENSIKGQG